MPSLWAKTKYNGKTLYYSTNVQLKICGHVIELRHFKKEFLVGGRPEPNKDKKKKDKIEIDTELMQKLRYWRAKRDLHDYINCNVGELPGIAGKTEPPVFVTLTFANNIEDIKYANREYSKFIQRLNLFVTKKKKSFLKYVVAIEFQKRGAVHYHVLFFNLNYIENLKDFIKKIWGHGFIKIKANINPERIARYMSKYMSKKFDDPRLHGRKCYFVSRGLKLPRIIYHDEYVKDFLELIPSDTMDFYSDDFKEENDRLSDFTRFNLINHPEILKQALAFLDITGYDIHDNSPTELDIQSYHPIKELVLPEAKKFKYVQPSLLSKIIRI
jgi:hypothetical protein